MRTLALLTPDRSAVENVIVGSQPDWPDAIDITDIDPRPGPGWNYDGDTFSPPPPAPSIAIDVRIPRDDFIERFTPDEWLDGPQRAQTDAQLSRALSLLMGKPDGMVSLTSPRLVDALGYMTAIGMLTPERAAVIGALPDGTN